MLNEENGNGQLEGTLRAQNERFSNVIEQDISALVEECRRLLLSFMRKHFSDSRATTPLVVFEREPSASR